MNAHICPHHDLSMHTTPMPPPQFLEGRSFPSSRFVKVHEVEESRLRPEAPEGQARAGREVALWRFPTRELLFFCRLAEVGRPIFLI